MKRSGAAIVAFTLVISACGGSDEAAEPAAEPTPTVEVEPSQTPLPPTPTLDPTPAATVVPQRSEDEQAVIAAWEKYLRLSIEARGKSPSAEALDFGSYATGPVLESLRDTAADEVANDEYIVGAAESLSPQIALLDAAFAELSDCVNIELEAFRRSDDSRLSTEQQSATVSGQLRKVGGAWLASGQETGGPCDAR